MLEVMDIEEDSFECPWNADDFIRPAQETYAF
jgi:hypothetical protein